MQADNSPNQLRMGLLGGRKNRERQDVHYLNAVNKSRLVSMDADRRFFCALCALLPWRPLFASQFVGKLIFVKEFRIDDCYGNN